MNLSIVQYDDDMSAQMPQEIAKKHAHLVAADVHGVEVTVEAETATLGAERDTRDGRNPVVTVAVTVDRCLTTRTPCLAHGWNQQEARFVNEDNMGAQPFGVFFTRGHTVRFHSAIRSSSRSMARRSGFWWLQPN